MRLMVADADCLDDKRMDAIASGLSARVPSFSLNKTILSEEKITDILLRGASAVVEHYGMDPSELDRLQDRGASFTEGEVAARDIRRALPSAFVRRIARSRLSLGAGNHFIELRRVDRILEETLAGQLGLRVGQLAVLLHAGSAGVGVYASNFYGPRPNAEPRVTAFCHFSRIVSGRLGLEIQFLWYRLRNPDSRTRTLFQYDAESEAGRRYRMALGLASNFASANRTHLGHQVRLQLRESLGKPDLELRLICCLPHISLRKEEHFGQPVWVHRHGAARALPPQRLPDGHPFKETANWRWCAGP